MKIKLINLFAILILIAGSCSAPESIDKANDVKAIQIVNASASNVSLVNNWIHQKGTPVFKSENGSTINFDFTKLMKSTSTLGDVSSLFVTQVGYNRFDKQSVTASFYELNNKILSVMFVRLTDNHNGTKTAEYFDIDNRLLTTAVISSVEKSISFTPNARLFINAKTNGCGQAVATCMSDMYSNAGWGSVILTLTTLIEPGTVVIVAAACAAGNCL